MFLYRRKIENIGIIFGLIRIFEICLFKWLDGLKVFRIIIWWFLNLGVFQVFSNRFYLGCEWRVRYFRYVKWVMVLVFEGVLDFNG